MNHLGYVVCAAALLFATATPAAAREAAEEEAASTVDDDDPFAQRPATVPDAPPAGTLAPRLQPPRLRLRVVTGLSLDAYGISRMQWSDGAREYESCARQSLGCGVRFAFGAGIDWSPSRFFGLGLHARWLVGRTTWEGFRGRHLDIVEVLAMPRFELPWKWRWPYHGARMYLGLPLGPAWSYQSRVWTRAVAEEWDSRTGLSVGLSVGMEMYWSPRWGFVVETNLQDRFLSADVTQTPVDEPSARSTERVSLRMRTLILSLALLWGPGRRAPFRTVT